MDESPIGSSAHGAQADKRGLRLRWPAGLTIGAILIVILGAVATPLGERLIDAMFSRENGDDAPFTVVATEDPNLCADGWVADQSVPMPYPDDDDPLSWDDWAAEHNAVPAGTSTILLTIQGRSSARVVLLGARVRVLERRPSMDGVWYHRSCGDAPPVRYMETDLDVQPPVITFQYDQDFDSESVGPIAFPYTVDITEVEILSLKAHTASCDCEWVIDLDWASEGRQGTYIIDKNGAPFRTSGYDTAVAVCLDDGREFQCDRPAQPRSESGDPQLRSIVDAYLQALRDLDQDRLRTLACADYEGSPIESDIDQAVELLRWEVGDVTASDGTAEVDVALWVWYQGSELEISRSIELISEQGGWRVCGYSSR